MMSCVAVCLARPDAPNSPLAASTALAVSYKIMRNIGNAFVRLGQFQDAIASFEQIMDGSPDLQTGFNLVLCYYASGEKVGDVTTRAHLHMRTGIEREMRSPRSLASRRSACERLSRDFSAFASWAWRTTMLSRRSSTTYCKMTA